MGAVQSRVYRHCGVHIPFAAAQPPNQWSSNNRIQENGFIFIDSFELQGQNIFYVQSVKTEDLFVNKLLQPGMLSLELFFHKEYLS
jgi:hypothetical protein